MPSKKAGGTDKLFLIAFFYTLGASLFLGLFGRPAEMGLVLLSGVLCMAFVNLDKIAEVRAGGILLKMKNLIDKGYATLDTVREITLKSSAAILEVTASFGRYGGSSTIFRRLKLRDELVVSLKSLEVSENDIENSLKCFNSFMLFDHALRIKEVTQNLTQAEKGLPIDWRKISEGKRLVTHTPEYDIATEEFQKFVTDNSLESPEVSEAIDDYDYFRRHKQLRRPEVWKRE